MAETYGRLLRDSGLPEMEARILLEIAAARPRSWLLARLNEPAEDSVAQLARRLYARRHAGEPIAYISGEREFYSLELLISTDVLIPRPETELLVELALTHLSPGGGRVIDLGTGSGAVAIAIAKHAPDAEVWAVDASPAALVIAERNAARHGVAVRFVHSDWLNKAPAGRFDLIVSNPPYIAEDDPHLREGDLRFEPRAALVSGADGLDAIRRIAHDAKSRLETGGWLLFEHGYDQAERCRDLLATYGYDDVRSWKDLAGHARVSGGRLL